MANKIYVLNNQGAGIVDNTTVKLIEITTNNTLIVNDDTFYIYTQTAPSIIWSITHNLGRNANVAITDNAGIEYEAQIRHNSINQLTIIFNTALSGTATLT